MALRHFITLMDLSKDELKTLIARAIDLKAMQSAAKCYEPFKNKVLAMIFEKSSTRTRVSFETAMRQCGGSAIFLSPADTQLGRGEPIEDTARVLSSMVDCVMVRTYAHEKIEVFSKYAKVPVINALTDLCHPCQLLADIQTYIEHRGRIQGKKVAWIGDGNNMCHSYIRAAHQFDFELAIASPIGYQPNANLVAEFKEHVSLSTDPAQAVTNADLVSTDVWASMGQEKEHAKRAQIFVPYQVDSHLMSLAKSDALFMHCLPAHRGEEVSAEVIDGPQSVVWDQAENRLHSQKALLEFLFGE
ncbi:ornithine carbamoyltransferase [Candidatus Thiomargarita nelsonii]|uniref:Ornithine carbamoyltransferase n=1 Tax=Candidatus Thiomargarita nelsonii TaxID=1003181 RepID=A0A0A6PR41_9GAMM|nr:ornithine carbamoyltransferase [Candidatus Thiomargarita nelsonii]